MARCPRCGLSVPEYSRCDRCGLMLGYAGLTVLIGFDKSPAFDRVRKLARRQPTFSEHTEENGCAYLRVTYGFSERQRFDELAAAAAPLPQRRVFVNGLEIRWPEAAGLSDVLPELDALLSSAAPRPVPMQQASVK
ncbi:MAG: hypothetical protein ACRD2R_02515 [Terriglobales bacterium]